MIAIAFSASSSRRLRPASRFSLAFTRTALRPSSQQSQDRAVPGSIALCAVSPLPGRGSCTLCPGRGWRGTHVPPRVHARERGGPEAALSTVRGDSQVPSPSGTPTTQRRLGLGSDRRLSTGARAIIQRSQRAFGHGALDAALDRLMMQPECPADRKKRGVFSIGQQYPRPLDPARRFSARLRYRSQLRRISFSKRQLNRPPPRCHDFSSRSLVGTRDICGNPKTKMNPPL